MKAMNGPHTAGWARVLATAAVVVLCLAGPWCCGRDRNTERRPSARRPVVLATTTSVYDTKLLDVLLPQFTQQTGYPVKPIAAGTGRALAMAARGEADLLLVHAPAAEERFIDRGHGQARFAFAHNDFVIVGPPDDPAAVRGASSVAEALAAIQTAGLRGKARFVSRGDQSGTHKKELSLWGASGLEPKAEPGDGSPWYIDAGVGQAAMLHVAYQRGAYALTDRATHLHLQVRLPLMIVYEGGRQLLNPYSVVTINPERHKTINRQGAAALRRFLLSSAVQEQIRAFGKARYGRPLFVPDAPSARPGSDR